jgi:arylsulfatase A-like enzyme
MRIYVIHVDRLPLWAIGAYGNEWFPTPNFDALAARSVVFDAHFGDVPRPLHPSSLTPFFPWCLTCETLKLADVHWIDAPAIHLEDTTLTWNEWLGRIEEEVTSLDQWLGQWLEPIDLATSWVVVANGRGTPLPTVDGPKFPATSLQESLIHLPLIIYFPGGVGSGRRVLEFSQTPDLVATLAELCQIPRSEAWHGESLLTHGYRKRSGRPYVVAANNEQTEWTIQTRSEKLIRRSETSEENRLSYFIKPDDRWEVCDLRKVHFARAERLERLFDELRESLKRPGPVRYPDLPVKERTMTDGDRETR